MPSPVPGSNCSRKEKGKKRREEGKEKGKRKLGTNTKKYNVILG